MSFRQRQICRLAGCSPVVSLESKTLENGSVVLELVDQSEKKLPDPALFDLQTQIDSGVNLEEVNSKVLSASSVNVDDVIEKFTPKSNTIKKEGK